MKLIHRLRTALTGPGSITYCDSCGQVCDPACRGAAARDKALNAALLLRGGR